jgi:hypothetical protein
MNIGSWFRSSDPAPSKADYQRENELAARVKYVDALLAMMVRKSIFILRLKASEPLPSIENGDNAFAPAPAYPSVINRLKVLSRLNPVIYAEPVQGIIEVQRGPHLLVYTLCFEDKAVPPFCDIHLGIRNA